MERIERRGERIVVENGEVSRPGASTPRSRSAKLGQAPVVVSARSAAKRPAADQCLPALDLEFSEGECIQSNTAATPSRLKPYSP